MNLTQLNVKMNFLNKLFYQCMGCPLDTRIGTEQPSSEDSVNGARPLLGRLELWWTAEPNDSHRARRKREY